jgi:nitrate reductase (cytochrome), electron transfer subunit
MRALRRSALVIAIALGVWLLLAGIDRSHTRRIAAAGAEIPTRVEAEAAAIASAGGADAVAPVRSRHTIQSEAQVFRTRSEDGAFTTLGRRPHAHPRTLATYRGLRAYPGAPPRVPHGLTADEFRSSTCNTCHERGGYSARFSAYVPVTPHPELTDCLQCHATDAGVVALPRLDDRDDGRCRQCHRPAQRAPTASDMDWLPAPWPDVTGSNPDSVPPDIPHELHMRGNCLACHMGPGAVAEIRISHPERANCRQCHLAPADAITGFGRGNGGGP